MFLEIYQFIQIKSLWESRGQICTKFFVYVYVLGKEFIGKALKKPNSQHIATKRKASIENVKSLKNSVKSFESSEYNDNDTDDIDMDKATSELLHIDVGADGKILDGNVQRSDSKESVLSSGDVVSIGRASVIPSIDDSEIAAKKSLGSRLFSGKNQFSRLVVNSTLQQALLFDSLAPMAKKSSSTRKNVTEDASKQQTTLLKKKKKKKTSVTEKLSKAMAKLSSDSESDPLKKSQSSFGPVHIAANNAISGPIKTSEQESGTKKANLAPFYDRNTSFAGTVSSAHTRSYSDSENILLNKMFKKNQKSKQNWKKSYISGKRHAEKSHAEKRHAEKNKKSNLKVRHQSGIAIGECYMFIC